MAHHHHWGYEIDNGPATWGKEFPIAVKGHRQSPIDIVTSAAKYDQTLEQANKLTIKYSKEKKLLLKNNGHSIMCQIAEESFISGGPLQNKKYRLEQFHLHWGASDDRGSEHTVNGQMYSAELHLVHWNTSYKSFAEAVDKPDGLAVLGVFIKIGQEVHATAKEITDLIDNVTSANDSYFVDKVFDPSSLLPGNIKAYWTYEGSLTTPPLYESVRWIVFEEPVEYSKTQILNLRSLTGTGGHIMQDNFRPPLPLYGRQVKASFK